MGILLGRKSTQKKAPPRGVQQLGPGPPCSLAAAPPRITTNQPAGWSPQFGGSSLGIRAPKWLKHSGFRIYNENCPQKSYLMKYDEICMVQVLHIVHYVAISMLIILQKRLVPSPSCINTESQNYKGCFLFTSQLIFMCPFLLSDELQKVYWDTIISIYSIEV